MRLKILKIIVWNIYWNICFNSSDSDRSKVIQWNPLKRTADSGTKISILRLNYYRKLISIKQTDCFAPIIASTLAGLHCVTLLRQSRQLKKTKSWEWATSNPGRLSLQLASSTLRNIKTAPKNPTYQKSGLKGSEAREKMKERVPLNFSTARKKYALGPRLS